MESFFKKGELPGNRVACIDYSKMIIRCVNEIICFSEHVTIKDEAALFAALDKMSDMIKCYYQYKKDQGVKVIPHKESLTLMKDVIITTLEDVTFDTSTVDLSAFCWAYSLREVLGYMRFVIREHSKDIPCDEYEDIDDRLSSFIGYRPISFDYELLLRNQVKY